MVVYGYARLVGYDDELHARPGHPRELRERGRAASSPSTLRPGHKWSDGQPFTAEDFRYLLGGRRQQRSCRRSACRRRCSSTASRRRSRSSTRPTVRYTWDEPNPLFLPALAGAAPALHLPAGALPEASSTPSTPTRTALKELAEERGARNWAALFTEEGRAVPQRQPRPADARAVGATRRRRRPRASCSSATPSSTASTRRAAAALHRPRSSLTVADAKLIPAKAGAGDADLQARYLRFDNYTVPQAEREAQRLYACGCGRRRRARRSRSTPTSTPTTPDWRELMRDVRFRRALSLGHQPARDQPGRLLRPGRGRATRCCRRARCSSRSTRPPGRSTTSKRANTLLDEIGPCPQRRAGHPPLPDGRPLEIVVDTAGEDPSRSTCSS